jgi:glycosyltransferase involved in cell wall biosynthesis
MDYIKEYSAVGAICLPTLPYLDLIKNLSRYDWGLVGFPISCDAFEYIAAGIPCLVYQSDEAAEFVQKNELGIVIDDINDIPGIYDQHEKFRKIVQAKKHEFTMKTQVDKILNLYKACLK